MEQHETEFQTLTPNQAIEVLKLYYEVQHPIFLWGHPGTAKSAVVKTVAEFLGLRLIDIRLAAYEAVDFNGLPVPDLARKCVDWLKANWLMLTQDNVPTLLFFDEFVQGLVPVQNVVRQLVLDRKSGEFILPDSVWIVLAGNLDTDRAGTNRLPGHVANSFAHFEITPDPIGFAEYAEGKFNDKVVQFVRECPDSVYQFDPKLKLNVTYRSWERVSDIENSSADDYAKMTAIRGWLSKSVASKYIALRNAMSNLIDPIEVITNPNTAPVTDDMSANRLLITALGAVANIDNLENILEYWKRVSNGAEYAGAFVRLIETEHPKVMNSSAYGRYKANNV